MTSELLIIENNPEKTAYNPTTPFMHKGKTYIGIRVESIGSELDSKIKFAYQNKNSNIWTIDDSINSLPLQDPAYIKIKNEILILGVRVWKENNEIKWQQDIYKGNSIEDLNHFTSGPIGMKDIRLIDLRDKIGIFTRPQGKIYDKGKIGYLEIKDINELKTFSEEDWYSAKLIDNLFDENHWGGVNHAINLGKEKIGIIGHTAYQTLNGKGQIEKHYRVISFLFDRKTGQYSNYETISKREDFPISLSKRSPELDNILFPAGLYFIKKNKAELYVGINDLVCGKRIIPNPFLQS